MRHPSRFSIRSVLVALGCLLWTLCVCGYTTITMPPTIWPAGTVGMTLKLGSAGRTLSDGSTSWDAVAQSALNTWNACLGTIQFTTSTQNPGTGADGDDVNQVFFSSSIYGEYFGEYTLAVTTTWRTGARRTEADVIFNTAWSWDSYRGYLRSSEDFYRVALHEFGHVLGLDHPDQAGQYINAVMNSVVSDIDGLMADDINGAHALYPAQAPAITQQPLGRAAAGGETVTFSVAVSGSKPMRYQWRLDNTAIPSATNTTCTIVNVQPSDAGTYTVAITNAGGFTLSSGALLAVNASPVIVTQPQSQMITRDQVVAMTVLVQGTQPLFYQWYQDGQPVAGATNALLAFPAQPARQGYYSVTVSNQFGGLRSEVAYLTIANPSVPQNGNLLVNGGFEAPGGPSATLTNGSTSVAGWVSVDTVDATELAENIHLQAPYYGHAASEGSKLVAFANYAPDRSTGNGIRQDFATVAGIPYRVTFDASTMISHGIAGHLAVSAGDATARFVLPNVNAYPLPAEPVYAFTGWSNYSFTFHATGSVTRLRFSDEGDGARGDASPMIDNVWVSSVVPLIHSQPASQTVVAGSGFQFSVGAGGLGPLIYQWFKNGAAVSGATNPIYAVASAQSNDSGTYRVRVSNASGQAESDPVLVTVGYPPSITSGPQSQGIALGQAAVFGIAAAGTGPFDYQWRKNSQAIPGATNSDLTLPAVQVEDSGSYSVVIRSPFGTVTSGAAVLTIYEPPLITTQPHNRAVPVGTAASLFVIAGSPDPIFYQWYLNGNAISEATNFIYTINSVRLQDAGSYRVRVWGRGGAVDSDIASVAAQFAPGIVTQPQNRTVAPNQAATFTVAATGVPAPAFQWFFKGQPIAGASAASYTIPSAQSSHAGAYFVTVSNFLGSTTSISATLQVADLPPQVIIGPTNQLVVAGSNLTILSEVAGSAPFAFQWYQNGRKLRGETNAEFRVGNVQTRSKGDYQLEAKNRAGVSRSDRAHVNVVIAPAIVSPERNILAKPGSKVSLRAVASGTKPFTYQWLKNGEPIEHATDRAFTIVNFQEADAGVFSVRVSNIGAAAERVQATIALRP